MKRLILALAVLCASPAAAQDYPPGNVVIASSGNVANAVATATMPAQVGKLNLLNGVVISAGGATAAATVTCTITGLAGGTVSFTYGVPAGATVPAAPFDFSFTTPLPAAATNTAIAVSCPALGTGNARMTITAVGHFK